MVSNSCISVENCRHTLWFTLDSPKASVPACIETTDIKAPISCTKRAILPFLDSGNPSCHLIVIEVHVSPPPSASVPHFKKRSTAGHWRQRAIQAHVLQVCVVPRPQGFSRPYRSNEFSGRGDAAVNFKCLPRLPLRRPAFRIGSGADASRDGGWLDLFLFQ